MRSCSVNLLFQGKYGESKGGRERKEDVYERRRES